MDLDRLRGRYRGAKASDYERHRKQTDKWRREQDAVTEFLDDILAEEDDPRVLDIPVGTGRFFDVYAERSVSVVGIDVSEDMLEEARGNLPEGETAITLQKGDIMDLGDGTSGFDVVVCMRFLNWLGLDDLERALTNLKTTSAEHLLVGIRVRETLRHHIGGSIRGTYHRVTRAGNSKTTIHDATYISRIFEELDLVVHEKRLVDRWLFGDKYVFWLRPE